MLPGIEVSDPLTLVYEMFKFVAPMTAIATLIYLLSPMLFGGQSSTSDNGERWTKQRLEKELLLRQEFGEWLAELDLRLEIAIARNMKGSKEAKELVGEAYRMNLQRLNELSSENEFLCGKPTEAEDQWKGLKDKLASTVQLTL